MKPKIGFNFRPFLSKKGTSPVVIYKPRIAARSRHGDRSKSPSLRTHKARFRIQMARATVAGDGPRLVHTLVLAVVGQARPPRAIPQDSCHVGPCLRLGRPCGSTHQQQLQVTVAHVHFLASHSGPRIGFRFRIQISRIYSSKACDV